MNNDYDPNSSLSGTPDEWAQEARVSNSSVRLLHRRLCWALRMGLGMHDLISP